MIIWLYCAFRSATRAVRLCLAPRPCPAPGSPLARHGCRRAWCCVPWRWRAPTLSARKSSRVPVGASCRDGEATYANFLGQGFVGCARPSGLKRNLLLARNAVRRCRTRSVQSNSRSDIHNTIYCPLHALVQRYQRERDALLQGNRPQHRCYHQGYPHSELADHRVPAAVRRRARTRIRRSRTRIRR